MGSLKLSMSFRGSHCWDLGFEAGFIGILCVASAWALQVADCPCPDLIKHMQGINP